jgi:chromosomal replication initiation ATPase DnaA
MDLGGQLRLELEHPASFSRDRFVVSASNRDAVQTVDSWSGEIGGALALIGPAGSGKTHLASAWAERTGAVRLSAHTLADEKFEFITGPMLLDSADVAAHGEAFFHLLNKAAQPGNALLLTGRAPPSSWPVQVQDLRSRLNALPVAQLLEPDDAILNGVLVKLFLERSIRPPQDLLAYLVRRIERSVPAAQAIVVALDEAAAAEHRAVSRSLARELLKDDRAEPEGED